MGNFFSEDFYKSIRAFGESFSESLKPINNIFGEGFTNLRASFEELGKQLREAANDIDKFKPIIVELGYPPHKSLSVPEMRMIVNDYYEHGVEYVRDYIDPLMESYYDDHLIEELTSEWESRGLISDRISILRSAIRCHKQQNYNASIPTLIPQLEGIIAKAFKHRGQMSGYHQKVYLSHLLNVDESKSFYSFEQGLEKYYIEYILVQFEHGKDIESDISRHAILHGGYVDYGHKNNSLKIILLFDFLLSTLSNLSEETIQNAKEVINKKKK
ncbi:hypothetical protein [Rossellomorea marisflavi]|uniref:hypothetical protein n=1 Tax=Rossellomorea marisflavi TaxID=189381 RepID=UPI00114E278B|nr:hypothetical protein [Rossellomorea marisflavi]